MGRTDEAQAHVLSFNYSQRDLRAKGVSLNVNGFYSQRKTYVQDTIPWAYNWDGSIRTDLNGNLLRRPDGAQQGEPTMADIDRHIANIRTNLGYEVIPGHRLSLNHVFYTVDREDSDLLNPMGRDALKSTNGLSKDVLSLNYEAQTFGNRLRTNLFAKVYQQSVSSLTYKGSVVDGQAVITENLEEDRAEGRRVGKKGVSTGR